MDGTLGVILAGGLARRMGGGDKGLLAVGGRPMLARVIERLGPQVDALAISANGDPARFAAFGLPVLPDPVPGRPGPLAGVLAGLEAAAARGYGRIVSVPADAPFLPTDLVARLGAAPAMAASGGRRHPVVALWPVSMREAVRERLAAGRHRVGEALGDAAVVCWPDRPVDPFFNVNAPADLLAAAAHDPTLPHRLPAAADAPAGPARP